MFAKFTIRIIGRSQKHSFRSIIGFALIISMMIAISGVISGFSAQIFGITEQAGESPSIFIKPKNTDEGIPSAILPLITHTNIKLLLPIVEGKMNVSSINSSFNSNIVGINISKFMEYYSKADVYAGRLPQPNNNWSECLVGSNLNYLVESSRINITNTLTGIKQEFHVSGLIQNVKEFQSTIIIDLTDYNMMYNQSTEILYSRIKIRLKNGVFVRDTISDLKVILSDYLSFLIIKQEQQADIFTESLFSDILTKLNLLFAVLFIIALIRIFHTISWLVRKYERDLLIMRSMGLSRAQTFLLVLFLAELIGNMGLIIGIFFGLLIPSLLFTFFTLFIQGGFFAPEFSIFTILPLLVLSNLIVIIAALYPAFFITLKSPSTLSLATHGLDKWEA
ncbi:MAG: ABC transporter permease [Candidatus Hodarchaeota archaeon]